ncbi:MAG: hypothetical protein V4692_15420 [Bdellovibrionota bacterium]
MAKFSGIQILKSVFAPIAKAAKVSPLTLSNSSLPPANTTCVVTRHDHHNIEIKTVCELGTAPSTVETDIYLFIPRNFELHGISKSDVAKDFRSRMRLSTAVDGEQGIAAFESALYSLKASLNRLESALQEGAPVFDLSHPLCEELLEATRDLCGVVAGTLKHASSEHVRLFFLSHTLLTTEDACVNGLSALAHNVQSVHDRISLVRQTAQSRQAMPAAVFAISDEYISQLYVQYLAMIRAETERLQRPANFTAQAYEVSRRKLEKLLDVFQTEEAKYRSKFGAPAGKVESELERERRLVRLSHLKKFFQSKSFVDITREHSAAKFGESTATAGTAVAGIAYMILLQFSQSRVAMSGFFFFFVGVVLYVLRDRLKDWAKNHFQVTASKFLPDFEQQLVAHDKKIGSIKEWLFIRGAKDLPDEISRLRREASSHEMEKRLFEDVIHCHKIQDVDTMSMQSHGSKSAMSRSLHENTRVNFERYLKHMDDPFKELTDLDSEGRFMQALSHRVYHFYLIIRTVSIPKEKRLDKFTVQTVQPRREQTLVYRIVLDKNGVVRLEDLEI